MKNILILPHRHLRKKINLIFRGKPRKTELCGSIYLPDRSPVAISRKPVIIFRQAIVPEIDKIPSICLHDINPEQEIRKFFKKHKISCSIFPENLEHSRILFLSAGSVDKTYKHYVSRITNFVRDGGILIIQEPEYGIEREAEISIVRGIDLMICHRLDRDQGGYDSYVFPLQLKHTLWKNLDADYFKMFNGGLGGEIVSQHNVRPTVPYNTLARCHLNLKSAGSDGNTFLERGGL